MGNVDEHKNLEASLEDSISLAYDVKGFAEKNYGLKYNGAYEKVESSDSKTLHCLYVSYTDRIETLSIMGNPCFQYFDEEQALKNKKTYDSIGHDTLLYSVGAYALDGCPLTKDMLMGDEIYVADSIIHEGFHFTLRSSKMKWPYTFNEGFATYVGCRGSVEYFSLINDDENAERATSAWNEWNDIASYVNKYHDRLQKHYSKWSSGSRDTILSEARSELNELLAGVESEEIVERFGKFPINNAFFLRYHDYTVHNELVADICDKMTIEDIISELPRLDKAVNGRK